MKISLIKDIFREIGNSLGRFISIFLIVALGVSFFAGIKATAPDMKITADKYFDDYNLMDIWLVSTMGFNQKDIEDIKGLPEVEGIAPSYSQDVLMDIGDNSKVVKLLSIPMDKVETKDKSYINRINLVEGRFPKKPGEILAESGHGVNGAIPIGSKVKLSSGTDEDILDTLKREEYTVVGLVNTPYYLSFERGTTNIGTGQIDSFLVIPEDEFQLSVYTDVYLTVKGAREVLTYDDEYDELLDPIQQKLEDVGEIRAVGRYDEIMDEAKEKLDEAKDELREGEEKQKKELKKAEQELADAKRQIDDGEVELNRKEKEFNTTIKDAENRLREEEKKLEQGEAEYNKNFKIFNEEKEKANKEIEYAELEIANGEKKIEQEEEQLNQLKQSIDFIEDEEEKSKTLAMIEYAEKKIQDSKAKIEASKVKLEKGRQELIQGEKQLEEAKISIEEGKVKLQQEKAKLENSRKTAIEEFAKGRRELANSKKEYEKGYREYIEAKEDSDKEIEEAREEIAKAEEELKDIEKPEWYVIKRSQTRDYIDYEMAADRIDAVARVFPVFFFAIAVLICLTTMTRMVDEQRAYIGSLKSIGYSNISIASKYLIYAATASISGSIVGLIIGFNIFPTVIFNAYRIMYIMPPIITEFNSLYAIISTAVAVFATTMAAWLACRSELIETPAFLLRPKAPRAGQRILLERINFIWSRLKFSQKVTARNLFRYKRRFFMTVIGISGCTALLVAGFGLKDSIVSIATKQFDEIYQYEMAIELKDPVEEGKTNEVLDFLNENSKIDDYILTQGKAIDIGKNDIEKSINLIVPKDLNRIKDFIILRDRVTGEEVSMDEEGIVLSEKMTKLLKVDIGDTIYIRNEDDDKVDVKITGITENYSDHYMYMPRSIYEEVFKEKVGYQRILAKTKETDKAFEDNISKELLENDDIAAINFTTGISKSFNDMIGSLNYVIMVIIISAGALAFIVLYNLTNINISERIREIATIKVLGFYDNEVSKYVYRENIILTLIGTVLGLIVGVFLHKFIIITTETEFIMFGREIRIMSFIYSGILTILFAALVNFAMYFKLKNVNMVESLKSVD